jgi:ketosteroid isomerase-like protein
MTTLEQRIQELADKDEIRELTARYCFAVADGQAEMIIDMFTPDGVFKLRDRTFAGTEGLREIYGDATTGVTPKPYIQNHVIDVSGDAATGRCGVEIRMVHKGEAYTVAGHYFDTYRRVEGRWKFAERDFRTYHWVPLAKGWA